MGASAIPGSFLAKRGVSRALLIELTDELIGFWTKSSKPDRASYRIGGYTPSSGTPVVGISEMIGAVD